VSRIRAAKIILAMFLLAFLLVALLPGILDEFGRWHDMKQIYPSK
jgi:hypothetical protein